MCKTTGIYLTKTALDAAWCQKMYNLCIKMYKLTDLRPGYFFSPSPKSEFVFQTRNQTRTFFRVRYSDTSVYSTTVWVKQIEWTVPFCSLALFLKLALRHKLKYLTRQLSNAAGNYHIEPLFFQSLICSFDCLGTWK